MYSYRGVGSNNLYMHLPNLIQFLLLGALFRKLIEFLFMEHLE